MKFLSAGRFEGRIGDEAFALRRWRIRDLRSIYTLFQAHIFQEDNSISRGSHLRFMLFVEWLLTSFQVLYLIEADSRLVGFIGLYDLEIGRETWISISVFDPSSRRKGYGRRGFALVSDYLKDNRLAEKIYAEVLKGNRESLFFFKSLGFEVLEEDEERVILAKRL